MPRPDICRPSVSFFNVFPVQLFQSLVISVLGSAAVALMWQFCIPWLTLWGVPVRIAMKSRVMLRVLMPAAILDAAYRVFDALQCKAAPAAHRAAAAYVT